MDRIKDRLKMGQKKSKQAAPASGATPKARAQRAVQKKQLPPPVPQNIPFVDLHMECIDEPLSKAQVSEIYY